MTSKSITHYLLVTYGIFCTTVCYGQEVFPTLGLKVPAESILRREPHSAAAAIPYDYKLKDSVDLSDKMPPCGNQGKQGACASFSAVYDCLTYLENQNSPTNYYINGILDSSKIFSPKLTYNLAIQDLNPAAQDCKEGLVLTKVLGKIKEYGAPKLKNMPYLPESEYDCLIHIKKDDKVYADAAPYKILLFPSVNKGDIKFKLLEERPVIIGMYVDTDLYLKGKYKTWKGPKFIYTYNRAKCMGYHAVVCVGYNEITHLYKLMNSWGSDWGNCGFFYMTYNELIKDAHEAYIILTNTTTAIDAASLNKLSFKTYSFSKTGFYKDWFRLGSYKTIGAYKIGVNYINKNKSEAIVSLTDKKTNKLISSIFLNTNQTKYFFYNNKKINITLNQIDTAGVHSMINDVSFSVKISPNQVDPMTHNMPK